MEKFNVMPEEKVKKKMDAWRSQLEPIIPGARRVTTQAKLSLDSLKR